MGDAGRLRFGDAVPACWGKQMRNQVTPLLDGFGMRWHDSV